MPARPRLGTLEYGRFVAATLVVIDHAAYEVSFLGTPPPCFAGRDALGILGVEYFFVLSGFVMLVAHRGDFGRLTATPLFWWRRICRIYPVYWLILPVPLMMFAPPHLGATHLLGLLTMLSPDIERYINPAWTLRYELTFYIVFGLALLPVVGRPLLALWIALLAWFLLPVPLQNLTYHPLRYAIRHIFIFPSLLLVTGLDVLFVAGLAAGLCYVEPPFGRYMRRPFGRAAGGVLVVLGAGILIALTPYVHDYSHFPAGGQVIVLGAGFACIILGLAVLERAGPWRCGKLAAWAGDMSYPLYLLHVPLLLVVTLPLRGRWHVSPAGIVLLLIAAVALSVAAAAALTWAFDRPVRRALRRLFPKSAAPPD